MPNHNYTIFDELSSLNKKVTYLKIGIANISQRINQPLSNTAELSACEQSFYAISNELKRLSGYKGVLWAIAYDLGRITLPFIHLAQKLGLVRNPQQTAIAKPQHSDERFGPYWIAKRLFMTHAQQKNHTIARAIQQQLNEISDQLTALRKHHSNYSSTVEYEDPPIITSAIGLARVDWGKFLRCISIFFLQYLVMGWSLLMSQPWHVTWYQWVISTLVNAVMLAMQTLSEEVLFRRPIIDKQSPAWQSLYNIIISSLVFGFAHAYNPEFSVFQGDVLSQFALLGSYICSGMTYALVAYFSGGLELVWGMHFAHNFFLTSIIGYTPCPIPAIPLVTKPFSPFKPVGSFAGVAWLWSKQISNFFISCLPIYILEMFYREKYFVQPLGYRAPEAANDPNKTQIKSRKSPRETGKDSYTKQPVIDINSINSLHRSQNLKPRNREGDAVIDPTNGFANSNSKVWHKC